MDSNKAVILCDYLGNLHLGHKGKYYKFLFNEEYECGYDLVQISDTERRDMMVTLNDNSQIAQNYKKGMIVLSEQTLKGRVSNVLKDMKENDQDLHESHFENNNFTTDSNVYTEDSYYTVERCNDSDSDSDFSDWDIDNEQYESDYYLSYDFEHRFCGVLDYFGVQRDVGNVDYEDNEGSIVKFNKSIEFSDMLDVHQAHNETLLIDGDIESKIVVSNIRRTDGYCSIRIIIYTDGLIKMQYPYSALCFSNLVINENTITPVLLSRTSDDT